MQHVGDEVLDAFDRTWQRYAECHQSGQGEDKDVEARQNGHLVPLPVFDELRKIRQCKKNKNNSQQNDLDITPLISRYLRYRPLVRSPGFRGPSS